MLTSSDMNKCSQCHKHGHNKRTCGKLKLDSKSFTKANQKSNIGEEVLTKLHNQPDSSSKVTSLNQAYKKYIEGEKVAIREATITPRIAREQFEVFMEDLKDKYQNLVDVNFESGEPCTDEELAVWWEIYRDSNINYELYGQPLDTWETLKQQSDDDDATRKALIKFLAETSLSVPSSDLVRFLSKVPPQLVADIMESDNAQVLTVLSRSPLTTDTVATLLKNKKIPLHSLVGLKDQPEPEVRAKGVSAARLKGKNVDFYAQDDSPAVRSLVAKKTNNDIILTHYVYNDSDLNVRLTALGNPKCSQGTLSQTYFATLTTPLQQSYKGEVGSRVLKMERSYGEHMALWRILTNPNTSDEVKEHAFSHIPGGEAMTLHEKFRYLYAT